MGNVVKVQHQTYVEAFLLVGLGVVVHLTQCLDHLAILAAEHLDLETEVGLVLQLLVD